MCTRATLAEVRRFQKIAGILTEGADLEEKLAPGKCPAMPSPKSMQNYRTGSPLPPLTQMVRWDVDGTSGYVCLWPEDDGNFSIDGHRLTKHIYEGSDLEEATLPNPAQPCGPDFTAFVTGPKPEDFACIPNTQRPPRINGISAKKVVPKTTTPTVPTVAPQA